MADMFRNESTILLGLQGESKEDILTKMAKNLVSNDLVKESFIDAIVSREIEYPTGLPTAGVAVAIPHTDVEHVIEKTISVAVLQEPVSFGVMGGDESEVVQVKLVFMLAMDESHSQLRLLQELMQVFQNEEELMKLVNVKTSTEMKALLDKNLKAASLEGGE